MHQKRLALLGTVLVAALPQSHAHHSFPAHYLAQELVTVEGVVTEWLFRNPHTFIHLAVAKDDGEVELWAVEWGGTSEMSRQGYTRETFKPGDEISVTGNRSRDGTNRIRLVALRRPADNLEVTRGGGLGPED